MGHLRAALEEIELVSDELEEEDDKSTTELDTAEKREEVA